VAAEEISTDRWILRAPPQPCLTPPTPEPSTTFEECIAHLPTWEHNLFADLTLLVPPCQLLAMFQAADLSDSEIEIVFDESSLQPSGRPTSKLASDGSPLSRMMTFGWSLSTSDG
jgi:hypothetical protein